MTQKRGCSVELFAVYSQRTFSKWLFLRTVGDFVRKAWKLITVPVGSVAVGKKQLWPLFNQEEIHSVEGGPLPECHLGVRIVFLQSQRPEWSRIWWCPCSTMLFLLAFFLGTTHGCVPNPSHPEERSHAALRAHFLSCRTVLSPRDIMKSTWRFPGTLWKRIWSFGCRSSGLLKTRHYLDFPVRLSFVLDKTCKLAHPVWKPVSWQVPDTGGWVQCAVWIQVDMWYVWVNWGSSATTTLWQISWFIFAWP